MFLYLEFHVTRLLCDTRNHLRARNRTAQMRKSVLLTLYFKLTFPLFSFLGGVFYKWLTLHTAQLFFFFAAREYTARHRWKVSFPSRTKRERKKEKEDMRIKQEGGESRGESSGLLFLSLPLSPLGQGGFWRRRESHGGLVSSQGSVERKKERRRKKEQKAFLFPFRVRVYKGGEKGWCTLDKSAHDSLSSHLLFFFLSSFDKWRLFTFSSRSNFFCGRKKRKFSSGFTFSPSLFPLNSTVGSLLFFSSHAPLRNEREREVSFLLLLFLFRENPDFAKSGGMWECVSWRHFSIAPKKGGERGERGGGIEVNGAET